MPIDGVNSPYWAALQALTQDELESLANLKRGQDLLSGDPVFARLLMGDRSDAIEYLEAHGVTKAPGLVVEAIRSEAGIMGPVLGDITELSALNARVTQSAGQLNRYIRDLAAQRGPIGFTHWAERQRYRLDSELGEGAANIPHSLFAIELSNGCSVGCKFCGVSARNFGGHALFDEAMARDWTALIEGLYNRFGSAASSGFLYWGTDPLDNPDYEEYACVFAEVCGLLPQVTTAIPLKNLERTRSLVRASHGKSLAPYRFSILTKQILRRVCKSFTPTETLPVEFVMQTKEQHVQRANAGRARQTDAQRQTSEEMRDSPWTIACVTGFLINIFTKEVRLISPTKACDRWPDGYRVHALRECRDFAEILYAIDDIVDSLRVELCDNTPITFRKDLKLLIKGESFAISNAFVTHDFEENALIARSLGDGKLTASQIVIDAARSGRDPEAAHTFLRGLFQGGLLERSQ